MAPTSSSSLGEWEGKEKGRISKVPWVLNRLGHDAQTGLAEIFDQILHKSICIVNIVYANEGLLVEPFSTSLSNHSDENIIYLVHTCHLHWSADALDDLF